MARSFSGAQLRNVASQAIRDKYLKIYMQIPGASRFRGVVAIKVHYMQFMRDWLECLGRCELDLAFCRQPGALWTDEIIDFPQ